jgi:hypothetical protein
MLSRQHTTGWLGVCIAEACFAVLNNCHAHTAGLTLLGLPCCQGATAALWPKVQGVGVIIYLEADEPLGVQSRQHQPVVSKTAMSAHCNNRRPSQVPKRPWSLHWCIGSARPGWEAVALVNQGWMLKVLPFPPVPKATLAPSLAAMDSVPHLDLPNQLLASITFQVVLQLLQQG